MICTERLHWSCVPPLVVGSAMVLEVAAWNRKKFHSWRFKYSTVFSSNKSWIALFTFWALFWAKNPFCNRDFLNIPFLLQKIYLYALFWGIMALLFNKISILFTFTMIFEWKFSLRISIWWIFRFHCSHQSVRRGIGMCIVKFFVACHVLFGPVKHFLSFIFIRI